MTRVLDDDGGLGSSQAELVAARTAEQQAQVDRKMLSLRLLTSNGLVSAGRQLPSSSRPMRSILSRNVS
jgi:hypothetical protein